MNQGVIFDIDGTLVDSVDLHANAWQEALAHFGHLVSFEQVRSQIGKGGDQLLPVFLSEHEITARGKEIEEYRSELFKRSYLGQVRAFPCVRELFGSLRRDGKIIALASSAKGDELQAYKRIAGIEDLLHAETSSDDAEKSKPNPDIFLAALERMGNVPRETVCVVGDSPYDAEAAGKAGLRTIGVLSGGFPRDSLLQAGCAEIYKDVCEILSSHAFSRDSRS